MTSRPVAIVYDMGAASLTDLLASVRRWGPIVFVAPDNTHVRTVRAALEDVGPVLELDAELSITADAVRRMNVRGIVTFSEQMVRTTAALAERLGLPYHDSATAELLTDKWTQRRRLRETGVDSTRGLRLTDVRQWSEVCDLLEFPVVVKPRVGAASRNAFFIGDADAGRRTATELLAGDEPELVVEEFLHGRPLDPYGDFVSVESFTSNGHSRHLAVVGKFPMAHPFREQGNIWPASITRAETDEAFDLASRALAALGVQTGLTHTEIKLTPEGPRIIEVNGRLGHNVNEMAQRAFGLDIIGLALDIAAGRPVTRSGPVRPASEVFFQYHNAAPLGARRVLAAFGAGAVRGLPGVDRYQQLSGPRSPLGGVNTHDLDALNGRADGYYPMFDLIDRALQRLVFVFEMPRGTECMTGIVLRDHVRNARL